MQLSASIVKTPPVCRYKVDADIDKWANSIISADEFLKQKNLTVLQIFKYDWQEVMDAEKSLAAYEQKHTEDLQKGWEELYQPVFNKIKEAIIEVAKEKGYTMVLSNSAGVILYSVLSDDIFNDVKKKLGIK